MAPTHRGSDPPGGLGRAYAMVAAVILVVGLSGVGLSVVQVASPPSVDVDHADAVVVHAGHEARLDKALALVRSGVAPVLVVSRTGSDYGRTDGFVARLCARESDVEVLCPVPEPLSTVGEARAFGRLADQRGWETVAVVTGRSHLTRARFAVSQCTDAEVLPVTPDPNGRHRARWVRDEWLATVATATVWRACW